ncbi:hypothetical protein O1611_g10218 [Lasiodiplodia mahajangana]|uniref:Uncharacterized protein n=1 Tax=Lasiodiplodia mahajangana TaxID=1108764 RepID=A0ACC2J0K4_9PEZI|nr:hypothetical protein O1611_g10218 [Lasiodiplodia mahajangana]
MSIGDGDPERKPGKSMSLSVVSKVAEDSRQKAQLFRSFGPESVLVASHSAGDGAMPYLTSYPELPAPRRQFLKL